SGLPRCTEEEFEGYEWKDNKKKDVPVDFDNHGMDCTRYFSAHVAGDESWGSGMAR
ncbi:hypothetical protein LCGC14_2151050, partial [marine sediment metagenome]